MADVLFVCTGNTCRSPMAECLFNAYCENLGLPYRAESAGLYTREGNVAAQNAFMVMKERGLSLSMHVSRPLSAQLIRESRLIVAMNEPMAEAIRERYAASNVVAFHPPVNDPFGGCLAIYRDTADELESRMPSVVEWLKQK